MLASRNVIWIIVTAGLLATKSARPQDLPVVDGDEVVEAISIPNNNGNGPGSEVYKRIWHEVRKYQFRTETFGNLVDWDFSDEAKELKVSPQITSALNKAISSRRQKYDDNVSMLSKALHEIDEQISGGGSEKDAAVRRQNLVKDFVKREEAEEQSIIALVEEAFPPSQYKLLMRLLLKKNWQRLGGSPLLCEYLNLNDKQIVEFEKVRSFGISLKPEETAKLVEILVAAEATLDRQQTEEFWIATGRMPANVSLEKYFADLPNNRKQELRKYYPVFRSLKEGNS